MSDADDPDLIAAEYVLGTLDEAERHVARARLSSDAGFAAAVAAWEHRLAPLSEMTSEVSPPDGLLERIWERLAAPAATSAEVLILRRRLTRWRSTAVAAGALAAALAIAVGLQTVRTAHEPSSYVAVLQKDASSPAFILSVDIAHKSFTVRPVSAPAQPGHDYELWIIDAKLGPPKSLGVVGNRPFTTDRRLPFAPQTVQDATYAVTIEPPGGSPTGKPTGPVVYSGRLIQATP